VFADAALSTINGAILSTTLTGAAGLTKTGPGTIQLRNANSFSGNTFIEDGRIVLGTGNDRLPVGTVVTLGSDSTSGGLKLGDGNSNRNQTLAGLLTSGSGTANRVSGAGESTFSTLTLDIASGTNVFGGRLGGDGTNENRLNLTKQGAGTLVLTGTSTYTGATLIRDGDLMLRDGSNQLSTAAAVTLGSGAASGRLRLGEGTSPSSQTLAALLIDGSGTANRVVGAGTGSGSGGTFSTLTLNVTGTQTVGGILGGPEPTDNRLRLVKQGSGTLVLSDSNSYGAGTSISAGVVELGHAAALGSGDVTVSGGALDFGGGTMANSVTVSGGTLRNGSIDVSQVTARNGTISVPLTGAAGLVKSGTGTLFLREVANYAGSTSIAEGRLTIGALEVGGADGNNRLPIGTVLTLGSGSMSGSLGLGQGSPARNQTLAGLLTSGSGTENRVVGAGSSSVPSTLTLDIGLSVENVFGGILGGPGSNENNLRLVKAGAGRLVLTGTSTATAPTLVQAGTLLIHGSLANTPVSVSAGAVFGGSGSIGGTLSFANGGLLAFDPLSAGLLLTGSDNVSFADPATFGVASLRSFDGSAINWNGVANGTYTLLAGTTTDFSTLGLGNFGAENALILEGGRSAYFQDGSLQLVIVPEPGGLLLAGLGVGIGVGTAGRLLRRRTKNQASLHKVRRS
jgi:fibronectin-binding autotransporter adhesin